MSARRSGARPSGTENLVVDLCLALRSPRNAEELRAFLFDILSAAELDEVARRWRVIRLIDEGLSYEQIRRQTHASTATIARAKTALLGRKSEGGLRLALIRLRDRRMGKLQ